MNEGKDDETCVMRMEKRRGGRSEGIREAKGREKGKIRKEGGT